MDQARPGDRSIAPLVESDAGVDAVDTPSHPDELGDSQEPEA
ncbi:hypothetical protein FHR34_000048 [Kitasatospora kifunensis]|uniref:Uncharacterized protein n=1 Tax=Kitasatospora kifunensis TaxID=58351 RepID=A0A7W7QWG2_KITKI|nr:hypothetical protein [Kitasatospora kifunensis]